MLRCNKFKLLTGTLLLAGAISGCSMMPSSVNAFFGDTRTTPEDSNVSFGNRRTPALNPAGTSGPTANGKDQGADARDSMQGETSPAGNPTSTQIAAKSQTQPQGEQAFVQSTGTGNTTNAERRSPSENSEASNAPAAAATPVMESPQATSYNATSTLAQTAANDAGYPSLSSVPPAPQRPNASEKSATITKLSSERDAAETQRQGLMSDASATTLTQPQQMAANDKQFGDPLAVPADLDAPPRDLIQEVPAGADSRPQTAQRSNQMSPIDAMASKGVEVAPDVVMLPSGAEPQPQGQTFDAPAQMPAQAASAEPAPEQMALSGKEVAPGVHVIPAGTSGAPAFEDSWSAQQRSAPTENAQAQTAQAPAQQPPAQMATFAEPAAMPAEQPQQQASMPPAEPMPAMAQAPAPLMASAQPAPQLEPVHLRPPSNMAPEPQPDMPPQPSYTQPQPSYTQPQPSYSAAMAPAPEMTPPSTMGSLEPVRLRPPSGMTTQRMASASTSSSFSGPAVSGAPRYLAESRYAARRSHYSAEYAHD